MKATPEDVAKPAEHASHSVSTQLASMKATPEDVAKQPWLPHRTPVDSECLNEGHARRCGEAGAVEVSYRWA